MTKNWNFRIIYCYPNSYQHILSKTIWWSSLKKWLIFSNLEAKKHHIFFSMDINHGCKNNQLTDILSSFFKKNINLAHIKLIALFMMALCKAKTVCFSKLSAFFDSPAKADSCLRRMQRFFEKHSISPELVAKFIFHLLPPNVTFGCSAPTALTACSQTGNLSERNG